MRAVILSVLIAVGLGISGSSGVAHAEPPTTHEIIYTRPSGFWTSNKPAENGAYRYRLLGIGVGLVLLTG
ncbi:MAG: hypothetical protein H0T79_07045, partial [Deltaproteobacteria bacterium]|nr:hypothetical protein [Deltaproteobacteria bacterium]